MTRLVIQFDVDGVLANFVRAFIREVNETYGLSIAEDWQPESWDVLNNLTPDGGVEVWLRILASPDFWTRVSPLVSRAVFDRIGRLQLQGHEIYFVTARPGQLAKVQTETWLRRQGVWAPTVLMTKRKGEVARALDADFAIEDKAENAWAVAWLSPGTRSYLVRRPYNTCEACTARLGSSRVTRVETVEQFLDDVEKEARDG